MLNWFSLETQLKMFKQEKLNAIAPSPAFISIHDQVNQPTHHLVSLIIQHPS